mmetsp:Transcript_23672/g.59797  ORF Transcript_23672/g.59797 Transcript_23672/m.59797 type:complete len:228 (+) Transcript_23672:425-1108(+)
MLDASEGGAVGTNTKHDSRRTVWVLADVARIARVELRNDGTLRGRLTISARVSVDLPRSRSPRVRHRVRDCAVQLYLHLRQVHHRALPRLSEQTAGLRLKQLEVLRGASVEDLHPVRVLLALHVHQLRPLRVHAVPRFHVREKLLVLRFRLRALLGSHAGLAYYSCCGVHLALQLRHILRREFIDVGIRERNLQTIRHPVHVPPELFWASLGATPDPRWPHNCQTTG